MNIPGMLDAQALQDSGPSWQRSVRQAKKRDTKRAKFIGRMFAVGIIAALIGGTVAIAEHADAVSQVTINKYIRANGGIPPCTHEDGSGQPGICYWDASERGNGKGYDYVAVPVKGQDKRIVFLTGPKAKRY